MNTKTEKLMKELRDKYKDNPEALEIIERNAADIEYLGQKYPKAGYGRSFRSWIYSENPQPYNSWGNGSAMRTSACAYAASSLEEAILYATIVSEVNLKVIIRTRFNR